MRLAPQESLSSQRRMRRVCRWVPEFSQLPCRHISPLQQLWYQHTTTACHVVLASATGMPEMLREVVDYTSPLIQTF